LLLIWRHCCFLIQPDALLLLLPPSLFHCQVLGLDVPIAKALAGCLVAAGVVALLAVVRALNLILFIVPDSIKLATVSHV
jgi:xanthine/uracil/vitamin C permease (AzgA family)